MANRRRSRGNIAKSIDQVRELIGHAVLFQIRNVSARVMDIPLFKVSANNLAMLLFLREKVWMTCNYNHQPSQGSPTLARKQMVRHSRFLREAVRS